MQLPVTKAKPSKARPTCSLKMTFTTASSNTPPNTPSRTPLWISVPQHQLFFAVVLFRTIPSSSLSVRSVMGKTQATPPRVAHYLVTPSRHLPYVRLWNPPGIEEEPLNRLSLFQRTSGSYLSHSSPHLLSDPMLPA